MDRLEQIEVIKLYRRNKKKLVLLILNVLPIAIASHCAKIFIVDFEPFFPSDKVSALTLPLIWINALAADLANTFHTTGLILYPLKTSENQRLSNVFKRGIERD